MMKKRYIIELSWKNLMNRKVRSLLTISGVIIGISTITFLISIGYGFERMTTNKIATKDTLYIFDVNLDDSDLTEISDKDVSKISNLDNIESVEPGITIAGKSSNGKINADTVVKGLSEKYLKMNDTNYLRGKNFSDSDTNSMIVSTNFLESYNIKIDDYSKSNDIDFQIPASHDLSPSIAEGQIITTGKMKIVGVIDDDSSYAILPYKTLRKTLLATNNNLGKIQVKDKSKIADTRTKVENLGFGTDYIGDTIVQIQSFFKVFRYVIGGFGFISMVVAILGMFNTLTVSLLERTREIGVLKSNGAVRKDIWRIFLSEALVISTIGGVFGIIFGITIGEAVNIIFNLFATKFGAEPVSFFYTPTYFIVATLIFTIVVGFLTGYYPSKRATKINALDALKYE